MRTANLRATALAVLAVSGSALGQLVITEYATIKSRWYEQTGPQQPAGQALFYSAEHRMAGSDITPATIGTATVTPSFTGDLRVLAFEPTGTVVSNLFANGPTEAIIDAATLPGPYAFRIEGGSQGPWVRLLNQPTTDSWSLVPFALNWSELQDAVANADVVVQFNNPQVPPAVNRGGVFWTVRDPSKKFDVVAAGEVAFAAGSFVIPAGALTPGSEYEASIRVSARVGTNWPAFGFPSVLGYAGFDTTTKFTLRTRALQCGNLDFNGDGASFDPTDIDAFLSVFSEGPCVPADATCGSIDFNGDGSLFDPCDIDAFLLVFSEGPCTVCGV
jgi:hypothetical protein